MEETKLAPSNSATAHEEGPDTFGSRLRRLMKEKGLNQSSLSKKVGIDRSDLNRMVNDKRQPRPEEVGWLAQALDTPPDALLDGLPISDRLSKPVRMLDELLARVLTAESEKDAAVARTKSAEHSLEEAKKRWADERAELERRIREAEADGDRRVQAAQAAAAQRERNLNGQLEAARAEVDKWKADAKSARASAESMDREVKEFRRRLGMANDGKVAAGLLGGLIGAMIAGNK